MAPVFIKATEQYNTLKDYVCAPLFKKVFSAKADEKTIVKIQALGFYRIFLNGKEFTKGYLAPYIANPEQIVYEDVYDVTKDIKQGENVIEVLLANGWYNQTTADTWKYWQEALWITLPFISEGFGVK